MKQNSLASAQGRARERLRATKSTTMPEPPQAKNVQRTDVPPSEGFTLVVDGYPKANYDDEASAKKAAADLLGRFPKLQVEIFDAATKTRSKV